MSVGVTARQQGLLPVLLQLFKESRGKHAAVSIETVGRAAISPGCFGTSSCYKSSRVTWRHFQDVFPPRCFWMWSLSGSSDIHDHCITCLCLKHAESAFVDESCSHCGWSPPCHCSSASSLKKGRTTSASVQGGLRVTLEGFPAKEIFMGPSLLQYVTTCGVLR